MKWVRAATKKELVDKLKNSWCVISLYDKKNNLIDVYVMSPKGTTAIDYQVNRIVNKGFKVSTFSIPDPECPLLPGER